MITIRNRKAALAVSARVSGTGVKPGMLVKFIQGAASGDQPLVVKASAADIADTTITKGIVAYNEKDSQTVDFDITPSTSALTVVDNEIEANAQVTVFKGLLEIAYHESALPTGFKAADVREAAKVAFDGDTGFPGPYNAGASDGLQIFQGMVYRVDGPEVTFLFANI